MATNTQATAVSIADLEAVAQAAMGLDTNGNPLPGNEESHKALAEAVKRLSAVQAATAAAAQGGSKGEGSASTSVTPSKDTLTKKPTEYNRTTGNYVSAPSRSTPQQSFNSSYSGSQQQQQQFDSDGTPVKRFQCHLCERAFARAYNLNTHLATHDPDPAKSKPFPCPYPSCKTDGGRSFSRKHDLQRHVASTHEHEPIPDDEEEIDENGIRVSQLAKLGLNTPGRKFRCDECGRAFVRRDALKRHQCAPLSLEEEDHDDDQSGTRKRSTSTQQLSASPSPAVANSFNGIKKGSDLYSNAMPSGLSLYTSTTPQSGQTSRKIAPNKTNTTQNGKQTTQSSGQESEPPFYPSGISYDTLSKEVQDMAMHLVAQATKYNQAHSTTEGGKGGSAVKSENDLATKSTNK